MCQILPEVERVLEELRRGENERTLNLADTKECHSDGGRVDVPE